MTAPLVAGVASNDGDSISFPVSVPAGTADLDLLIGVVSSDWGADSANAFPTPAWTKLTTSSYSGGTDAWHTAIYARIASSEPASYTVSLAPSSGNVAAILRITGWDSAAGIAGAVKEVAPVAVVGGVTTLAAPSIVPAGGDDLLITFHGGEASGSGARTWTQPPGMSEQLDRQSTIWTSLEVSILDSPSNPSGTKTATVSATIDNGAACTISIKAVAGGAAAVVDGNTAWFPAFMSGTGFPEFMLAPFSPVFPSVLPYDTGVSTLAAAGAGGSTQRTQVVATGGKVVSAASGQTTVRSATVGVGLKQGTGAGADPDRSQTSAAAVKAATGTAGTQQRSVVVGAGVQSTGRAGLVPQRSMSTDTGVKAVSGAGVVLARTTTAVTSSKQATASGAEPQRSVTQTADLKATTGTGVDVSRSRTVQSGARTGLGAGRSDSRSLSTQTGAKAATGAAADPQRSITQAVSITGGSGRTVQRSTVTAAGTKILAAAGVVTCRTSTQGSGTAARSATGLALTRTSTRGTAVRAVTSLGRTDQRSVTQPGSRKLSAGTGRSDQRTLTQAVHLLDQTGLRIRTRGREAVTMAVGRENDTTIGARENDTTIGGREQGT